MHWPLRRAVSVRRTSWRIGRGKRSGSNRPRQCAGVECAEKDNNGAACFHFDGQPGDRVQLGMKTHRDEKSAHRLRDGVPKHNVQKERVALAHGLERRVFAQVIGHVGG